MKIVNFTFCSGFLIPLLLDYFYGKNKFGLFYCVYKNLLDLEYMNRSSGVWQESVMFPNPLLPSQQYCFYYFFTTFAAFWLSFKEDKEYIGAVFKLPL